jgi:CelD/BcsL family acetyltransferase involved in cellulose biosynthesis
MWVHADFTSQGFTLPPMVPGTGPFGRRDFLEVWWRHRAGAEDEPWLVESGDALLPLWSSPPGVRFLGEEHLIDYHVPLGRGVESLMASFAAEHLAERGFRFDSLPLEAAEALAKGLAAAGVAAEPRQHEVTAVLDLPADYEDYLLTLSKKERHEVRRKRRRFETMLGPPRLLTDEGPTGLATFVAMHRQAAGEKGTFMSAAMEAYFRDLLAIPGAVIHLLAGDAGPVAAVFGFSDADGYFLYNSSYDPAAGAASPGVVLVAMLIERAIMQGVTRFDFLKGDEAYKFRLGARPRPLYVLERSGAGS